MHPPETLTQAVEPRAPEAGLLLRLRRDYAIQGLLVFALLANFALLGLLLVRYNSLPDPLPLHFDASGLPDRIEAKSAILALPEIGLIVIALNSLLGVMVYRRERAATVLLLVGALFVQVLMWLATLNAAG